MSVKARFFDGITARAHEVMLSAEDGRLRVQGEGFERHVPAAALRVSERLGGAPRMIHLDEDAFCEVSDHAALVPLLEALSLREGVVSRWQRSARWVLASISVVVVCAVLSFTRGVPALASFLADRMPPEWSRALGEGALEQLDDSTLFVPSQVPLERQQHLRERYAELDPPPGALEFRASRLGANAFALPDGTVVLTDALVDLAASDDEILAVLGHEAGHIVHRHHLRQVIRGSLASALVAYWFGDVNGLLAAVPLALVNASHSREDERDADDHAAMLLRRQGKDPQLLVALLERIEAARTRDADDDALRYFRSHPMTAERRARLVGDAR